MRTVFPSRFRICVCVLLSTTSMTVCSSAAEPCSLKGPTTVALRRPCSLACDNSYRKRKTSSQNSCSIRRISAACSPMNFFREYRLYRRDGQGGILKQNDLLMNCLRHICVAGGDRMRREPTRPQPSYGSMILPGTPGGWSVAAAARVSVVYARFKLLCNLRRESLAANTR